MITRTITIEISAEDNMFTVRDGDRWCPKLCWDEMLGTIAELTHPRIGEARYRMGTAEQHRQREERYQQMRAVRTEESA